MASTNPLVFIVSQPVGSPAAHEVASRLAEQGIRPWIGSLAPGGELDESAMDALRGSAAVLLIFDRAAAQSEEVARHLLVGRQTSKPLIALRIEDVDPGVLGPELARASWIDGSSPEAAIAEIRRHVGQHEIGPSAAAGAGPRIEVLRASPGAGAARPADQQASSPRVEPLPPGAAAASHAPMAASGDTQPRGRRVSSSTMLLGLLALIILSGALLYTYLQARPGSGRESAERPAPMRPVARAPMVPAPEDEALFADESQPGFDPSDGQATLADPAPASEQAGEAAEDVAPAAEPAAETPAPEPVSEAAPTPASDDSAVETVRSFYGALSGGNGAAAAQLVVPAKRQSGPLSGAALTRYFSSFRRPLRVRRVTPVDANTVRVAYDYVLADGRLCEGQASVNLVQSGNRKLVSGIRTQGPC